MINRKSFHVVNTHIVRNCSSTRCKMNSHSHSNMIEVLLESDSLDNGQMIVDFGLVKNTFKTFIKAFENVYVFWEKEGDEYKTAIKSLTDRWVQLPISPSAEAYSLFFTYWFDKIIKNTEFNNGESNVRVHSVVYHETRTGYAQSFLSDLEKTGFKKYNLDGVIFSPKMTEVNDLLSKITKGEKFVNPVVKQQV